MLRCPLCRKPRLSRYPADRYHESCRQRAQRTELGSEAWLGDARLGSKDLSEMVFMVSGTPPRKP